MKIAMITGAGSGIGREVALTMLSRGYAVVLAGRNRRSLEATAFAGGNPKKRVLIVPTDITEPASVEHLFVTLQNTFGRLDVLFNNAGTSSAMGTLLEELPIEQWRKVVDTNLTGTFLCIQQAFKIMKNQQPMGGRIINNGSISAHTPRPNSAPYTATKHAVTGLTKSVALDGRKYNIACSQIDIGNARTDMTEKMNKGVEQADGSLAVEPTIDLSHVADAVLYMADLPLEANVLSMTVMATKMPYVGRG